VHDLLDALRAGQPITRPTYDFTIHDRLKEGWLHRAASSGRTIDQSTRDAEAAPAVGAAEEVFRIVVALIADVQVVDRLAPGISEAIRADARERTPHALLSRGIAGLRGSAVVVNLPGSPGGCRDGYAVLRTALVHGSALARGDATSEHRQT
jgi:hypothetical protein